MFVKVHIKKVTIQIIFEIKLYIIIINCLNYPFKNYFLKQEYMCENK